MSPGASVAATTLRASRTALLIPSRYKTSFYGFSRPHLNDRSRCAPLRAKYVQKTKKVKTLGSAGTSESSPETQKTSRGRLLFLSQTVSTMPSSSRCRSSRRSATAALLAVSISTTAPSPDVLVSAWVGPSVVGRAGRGLVRARPTTAWGEATGGGRGSGKSCRCGVGMSSSSSSSSGEHQHQHQHRRGPRNGEGSCGGGDHRPIMTPPAARSPPAPRRRGVHDRAAAGDWGGVVDQVKRAGVGALAGLFVMAGAAAGGGETIPAAFADVGGLEPTSSVTVQDLQRYDGFEDYAAQGQQMENSDVGCFANECKRETASCFTDGSCLKVCPCACRRLAAFTSP